MMLQSFGQLINTEFDVKRITVVPYTFEPCDKVEYRHGRKNNLLHFVTYGTRKYNVNSRQFEVNEGDIIFIPAGTVYSCYTENGCSGVGICFDMVGEEEIVLPPDVYTNWQVDSNRVFEYVDKLTKLYLSSPTGLLSLKAVLLNLLNILARSEQRSKNDYLLIKPAVDALALDFCENRKISEYAQLCNMSESYFRKKFVKCMGVSPIYYRNELRFVLARRLYSEGRTLQEIAEIIGFYDAGFLSKAYKKHTGNSLKNTLESM